MSTFYVLIYIHTDEPELSEVLGVFKNKKAAAIELLERANYRKNKDGNLTQYMRITDEYESYDMLLDKVMKEMELHDVDIYRIEESPCF
jgi:hypothetical protein